MLNHQFEDILPAMLKLAVDEAVGCADPENEEMEFSANVNQKFPIVERKFLFQAISFRYSMVQPFFFGGVYHICSRMIPSKFHLLTIILGWDPKNSALFFFPVYILL